MMASLDPQDIDAGRGALVARAAAETTAAAQVQASEAAVYVERFAAVEGGTLTAVRPLVPIATVTQALDAAGFVEFKTAKLRGLDNATALAYARTRISMAARGLVMGAGRQTVIQSARASGGRWRRVVVGAHTCAFCAMLASRGPVYAAETVDFDTHGGCDCYGEPCFESPAEWLAQYATPEEVAWVNAYFEAAQSATTAGEARVAPVLGRGRHRDTILHRMRAQHPELFTDGKGVPRPSRSQLAARASRNGTSVRAETAAVAARRAEILTPRA